jgi:alpha-beta hydrolase superfamily lysophospholipase
VEESTFTLASDGEQVFVYRWSGPEPAKAVVQIAHGMGEHALRYKRLAEALVEHGYVVYANDHRGHGRTAGTPDRQGQLGKGGWKALVDDVAALTAIARKEHPGLPLVLVGHSMGSFAIQCYLLDRSDDIDGAVLSGTTALDVVAAAMDTSQPADLTAFNAPFEPARTPYDWLSRDPDEVDAYIADPWCGFGVEAAATADLVGTAAELADSERLGRIRSDLPIYVFSGSADPLAGGGALMEMVADRYRAAGVADVTHRLYPEARHETFNETNRDEVTNDLIEWLDRVTATAGAAR